jgi:hypothetical protein
METKDEKLDAAARTASLELMRAYVICCVVLLFSFRSASAEGDADKNWVDKTVIIKTGDQMTSQCVRLENYVPAIGSFSKGTRELCGFKVASGPAPGTVMFQSVKEPTLFLQHGNFRLQLLKGTNENAMFRLVRPLRGTRGVSLQAFNFPAHHIAIVERGFLSIVANPKDTRKAVFFIEELPK